jgi:hypothetical protein
VLCAIEKYEFASMPLTLIFLSLAAIAVKSRPKSPPSACSFPPCNFGTLQVFLQEKKTTKFVPNYNSFGFLTYHSSY